MPDGPAWGVAVTPGYEAEAAGDAPAETYAAEDAPVQKMRYLRVANITKEKVKVYVQYRAQDNGKWTWFPADPANSQETYTYEIAPGQALDVDDPTQQLPVAANRVRIWAESTNQNWEEFKDKDLWLVEKDTDGRRQYQSPEPQVFVMTLR